MMNIAKVEMRGKFLNEAIKFKREFAFHYHPDIQSVLSSIPYVEDTHLDKVSDAALSLFRFFFFFSSILWMRPIRVFHSSLLYLSTDPIHYSLTPRWWKRSEMLGRTML